MGLGGVQDSPNGAVVHPDGGSDAVQREGYAVRVEHLSSPGCPNAAASRDLLVECLAALGVAESVIERIGAFPSPSVRVVGIDVMRPGQPLTGECCRLDVPTRTAIMAALRQALDRES